MGCQDLQASCFVLLLQNTKNKQKQGTKTLTNNTNNNNKQVVIRMDLIFLYYITASSIVLLNELDIPLRSNINSCCVWISATAGVGRESKSWVNSIVVSGSISTDSSGNDAAYRRCCTLYW